MSEYDAERHVTRRCPRMREHGIYRNGVRALPVPCEDCYSIESVWRRIPYEHDSKTPVCATTHLHIDIENEAS